MKLYFGDTKMSYREMGELLSSHVGPAGPDTWQNGMEFFYDNDIYSRRGFVEIYSDHPSLSFIILKWN